MTTHSTSQDPLLTLPGEGHAEEADVRAFWTEARRFHRTGRGGGIEGKGLVPALLARFRDTDTLRYAYPLWVADPEPELPETLARPLTELLDVAMTAFAPEPNAARALRDNLPRIELAVREQLAGAKELVPFRDVVESAVGRVVEELGLPGQEGAALAADAEGLLKALPASGSLLALSPEAPIILFEAVSRVVHHCRLEAFGPRVLNAARRIRDRLDVEDTKGPEARDPDRLASSFGVGQGFIDAKALADILPSDSASEAMQPARLERFRKALGDLESFSEDDPVFEPIVLRLDERAPDAQEVFVKAVDVFESRMQSMARLVAALQVSDLELRGEYDPSVHDEFYAEFDWRNFSAEEAAVAAPVVIAVNEDRLAEDGLRSLTRLLFTGRPLKMIVLRAGSERDTHDDENDDMLFRREMEHLTVAQPETFVLQSCAVDPVHMATGYARGLATPRPAVLHVFAPRDGEAEAAGFLTAGAAVDSRDFPLFQYDPNDDGGWSTRFSIAGNPQPETDWPVHELPVAAETDHESNAALSLAFTFADRAAAQPAWSGRFLVVPPRFWCTEMTPLADYLGLEPTEAAATMPYVWMSDEAGHLHRVVPAHDVVLACRDRLNHWRILQELGGVCNPHAARAAEIARTEAFAEAAHEREALEKKHEDELDRVRRETAGEAMERLTSVLMNLDGADLTALATVPATQSTPVEPAGGVAEGHEPATAQSETQPETEAAPAVDDDVTEEAWIASALCTSCNECIDLNPLMFKYNGDKLAYLADVHAGTYAQLVVAAEKCPARCIHPGSPLNPDEPNLEALLKRAEKFA